VLNRDHPGCFYISHEKLGQNLKVSVATAERITRNLREWKLIELKRRGAGLYNTANFYAIRPLTQDLLDALCTRFATTLIPRGTIATKSATRIVVKSRRRVRVKTGP
jgi:hypothetical protein